MLMICFDGKVPIATSWTWFPTGTVGFIGEIDMAERPVSAPVPARLTVCGLVVVLSITVNVPVLVPRAVGVNVTETLQVAPAASVFGERGHVDVWAKSPVVEIPEIVTAVDSAFLNVTDWDELVVVISWLENVSALAESVTGRTPVPVRETVCGLLGALSFTDNVPETVPPVDGVNVTETVQVVLPASVLGESGQFDVCPKLGEVEMLVMVSGVDWLFFTVTVFDALVVFTVSFPKAKLTGDKTTAVTPVPVRAAVWGLFEAPSFTVSVPVCVPDDAGLKFTVIVHDPFAASVCGEIGQFDVCE
jgi:hypothetical protein